jgi:hypothetical protein
MVSDLGKAIPSTSSVPVEVIEGASGTLAYILRADEHPVETTFVTPSETTMQAGFIVYQKGGEVARHVHRPLSRSIVGTAEVLVVRRGACDVELYDEDRQFVARHRLRIGDVIVLVAGGHGFKMLEDTVLLEVKQGPYTGVDEKERF